MGKDLFTKEEVINYVWQHSKYHGNLLSYCEKLSEEEFTNGFASLIFLFNLTENIFKGRIKDYDANFIDVIKKLKRQGLITQTECTFLNGKTTVLEGFETF